MLLLLHLAALTHTPTAAPKRRAEAGAFRTRACFFFFFASPHCLCNFVFLHFFPPFLLCVVGIHWEKSLIANGRRMPAGLWAGARGRGGRRAWGRRAGTNGKSPPGAPVLERRAGVRGKDGGGGPQASIRGRISGDDGGRRLADERGASRARRGCGAASPARRRAPRGSRRVCLVFRGGRRTADEAGRRERARKTPGRACVTVSSLLPFRLGPPWLFFFFWGGARPACLSHSLLVLSFFKIITGRAGPPAIFAAPEVARQAAKPDIQRSPSARHRQSEAGGVPPQPPADRSWVLFHIPAQQRRTNKGLHVGKLFALFSPGNTGCGALTLRWGGRASRRVGKTQDASQTATSHNPGAATPRPMRSHGVRHFSNRPYRSSIPLRCFCS
ncbi:hypothetical protein TCSYLVIO_005903 [Trypanosoma cruzi]|nr:hypothetical protein TCSYLVIO_005903 [Trypanosoma cruzi]